MIAITVIQGGVGKWKMRFLDVFLVDFLKVINFQYCCICVIAMV